VRCGTSSNTPTQRDGSTTTDLRAWFIAMLNTNLALAKLHFTDEATKAETALSEY